MSSERKQSYFQKLTAYLQKYEKILLVKADNVGSTHLSRIRVAIRAMGGAILMGKNTMMRKCIRGFINKLDKTEYEDLLPQIKGNIGFVFLNGDENPYKQLVEENRVSAAAKAGTYALNDVIIPAGLTGLEPTMTGFLQALAIQSKITKGQIEMTHDVHLIKANHKVGPSEATLLSKLNIKPFRYGLVPTGLFADGIWTAAEFLDITPKEVVARFQRNLQRPTALSLGLEFPTFLAAPHLLIKGYKNVLAIGLELDFKFKQVEDFQKRVAEAPPPAPVATTSVPAPETKKEEPVVEEKVSSEGEIIDLFG